MKQLSREIDRIAGKKGPNYVGRLKEPYRELLQKASMITQRARELCVMLLLPNATTDDIFGPNTLQAFIARTERVINTATRRIIDGETVPNSGKLFSVCRLIADSIHRTTMTSLRKSFRICVFRSPVRNNRKCNLPTPMKNFLQHSRIIREWNRRSERCSRATA